MRPLEVYKERGKWWWDCRICNWSTPNGARTQQVALVRALMHHEVAHENQVRSASGCAYGCP